MTTPTVVHLTDAADAYPELFISYNNEAEALEQATKTGQPAIYKLPRQDTWLVAVCK